MAKYRIHPIRVGSFEKLELSSLTLMHDQGVKIKAPLIMYLIENDETAVLVDTGGSDEAWSSAHHTRIVRPPEEEPLEALRRLGYEAEDILCIVNTHLHWDHCFNNALFPNARIYVQEKELDYAKAPLPAHWKFYEAEQLGFTPAWKLAEDKIVSVCGELELFDGIKLIPLPGHSPGFQGVLVDTEAGRCMIAGDCVGLISNIENKLPHQRIASGIYTCLKSSYDSLETVARLADYVLPGHDARVFESEGCPSSAFERKDNK